MEAYVIKRKTLQGISYYKGTGFTILLNFARIYLHRSLAELDVTRLEKDDPSVSVQLVNIEVTEKI